MPVVISDDVVLSLEQTFDEDNPVIGYENLITVDALLSGAAYQLSTAADVDDEDFVASNMGLPNTDQYWQAEGDESTLGAIWVQALFDGLEPINYLGIAGHNFGTDRRSISLWGARAVDDDRVALLHFDTDFTDEEANTWTPGGSPSAVISADAFFGEGAVRFDSVNYITTPDATKFTLGSSNFRISTRFFCDESSGTDLYIAGQCGATVLTDVAWLLGRNGSGDVMQFELSSNGSSIALTLQSLSAYTDVLNTGYHSLVIERIGNTVSMYIDNELQSTGTFTGSVHNSASAISIGRAGENTGDGWVGLVDEWYWAIGTSITAHAEDLPFAFPDEFVFTRLTQDYLPANNAPIMLRFTSAEYTALRLVMSTTVDLDTTAVDPPLIAVLYAGELLVCERKVQAVFTPINYGRRTDIMTNRSENGNFLGRVVVSEWVESSVNLAFLSPDWYRAFMDPFVENAETLPFFFAWAPISYPDEVGYAWLMEDAVPQYTHPGDEDQALMAITLRMQGVVETTI